MRLKYKLGYFLSAIIIVVGLMLKLAKLDEYQMVFYFGILGVGISGLYYFFQDANNDKDRFKWVNLIISTTIIFLVAIHFMFDFETYYFVFIGYFIMKAFNKKFDFQSNNND